MIVIIALIAFIVPFFFNTAPCVLCLTQRTIFFFIGTSYLLKFFKITKILNLASLFIAIFHSLILLNIINTPKFCKINKNIFDMVLSPCNQSSFLTIFGLIILNFLIFLFLIKKK